MVKGKIDLIKEKIKEDPHAYYEMRAKYHEGLLANLKFQKVDSIDDPALDKKIRLVERKLKYYKNQLNKGNGNN